MMACVVLGVATALLLSLPSTQALYNEDGFSPRAHIPSDTLNDELLEDEDISVSKKEVTDWLHHNPHTLGKKHEIDKLLEILRSDEADDYLKGILKDLFHDLRREIIESDEYEGDKDDEDPHNLKNFEATTDLGDADNDADSDEDLLKQHVADINFELDCQEEQCDETFVDDASDFPANGQEKLLSRTKRSPSRVRSSSRSSSRGSSGGWLSRSSRRRDSSSGSRWGSRTSSSSSSRNTPSSSSSASKPSTGTSGSSSTGSSGSSYGWNTGSSGGSSASKPKVGTGAGVAAGAGAATGTASGSSYPLGNKPAGGYPTGSQPSGGYPGGTQPVGGYPSGTKPVGGYPTGTQPVSGYPGGTQPVDGYPSGTKPVGGYPTGTQPVSGYPGGTQPVGGYPSGTKPVGGYPTGTQPVPGYPGGTQPVGGYPSGTRPAGGYPTGTQPVPGYPGGTQPVGGYPSGTRPAGGYPTGTQPVPGYPGGTHPGGYPSGNQPFGSYPSGNQPFGRYPTGNQPHGYPTYGQPHAGYPGSYQPVGGYPSAVGRPGGFPSPGMVAGGFAAGSMAGRGFGGYPVGGYPMPQKRKKSKKDKAKDVVKTVVAGIVAHKVAKKSKFLAPGHLSSYGHGYGGLGGKMAAGGLAGAAGGKALKIGKKLLGAYVKIQIAKYALKFGAEVAKAYFLHKMGLDLDEYMIGKFVHRYHQYRVRGDSRWRYYHHHGSNKLDSTQDTITLGEFCHRPCVEGDSRICQFNFDVHLYQTMSRACYDCPRNLTDCDRPDCVAADGIRRMVVTVNKLIPGPAIQVCVGDKVVVDVMNNLPSTALALHWHGLTMGPSMALPNGRPTPYMDGTPGVTQCPISPGSGFRYTFFASDPGTHFWHAQAGLERGDGVFGPLVVHQPITKDPKQMLSEHLLTINDWSHKSTQAQYANKNSEGGDPKPDVLLINGRGPQQHQWAGAGSDGPPRVSYSRFMVEKGTRYRLRVINAASTNCPVTVTLDKHDLILLAADGAPVSPVNVSAILLHPGERYDAMFSAEQDPDASGGTYWLRVTGGGHCSGLQQFAALQYLPSNYTLYQPLPPIPPTPTPATNPSPGAEEFSGKCGSEGQRCLAALRAQVPLPEKILNLKATFTFYLAFSSKSVHNQNFYSLLYYNIYDESEEKRVKTPQINHLTFRPPPKPLLVNRKPLRSENCNADAVRRGQCNADFCECIHSLDVPLGAVVDLVLIGEGPTNGTPYPVHLHGYKFWVLSHVDASRVPEVSEVPSSVNATSPSSDNNTIVVEGALEALTAGLKSEFLTREKVMQLEKEGKLVRSMEDPVIKDSVAIPPGGYTIVRIAAENAGVWALESQVLMDAQAGMALVLQVGTASDLPKTPPIDFPTC
ncbi:uncharacterized protein [Procambarus clarkii]|uniref:uncharacterized protein n=1 Tax=Procambarus clarkii TaxID=6728 RepID=UPI00374355E6